MKLTGKTTMVFVLLALTTALMANDQPSYTITGTKDPRLDAWFMATYVSQNPDEECTSKNTFTGGRRFALGGRTIKVEDENYTIEFPIKVTGENNDCDYRFRKLELVMKRLYDDELASIHYVLSDRQEVSPVYWKTKGGAMQLQHSDTPPYLRTDKKYFRIAKESTFLCKTFWFEERNFKGRDTNPHTQFHCTMQINNDVNRTLYKKAPEAYIFSHPEFGVDKLTDEIMQIDILVDEKNCKAIKSIEVSTNGKVRIKRKKVPDHFRELKEPNFWQKLF